jgi:cell division protein FtsB
MQFTTLALALVAIAAPVEKRDYYQQNDVRHERAQDQEIAQLQWREANLEQRVRRDESNGVFPGAFPGAFQTGRAF